MNHRRFRLALFALVLFTSIAVAAGSFAAVGQRAPLDSEYLRYSQERSGSSPQTALPDTRPLGYRPSPLDLSHVTAPEIDLASAADLPASYDLRVEGAVTDIRDQNPYGTCWAFGAMASLESTFRKAGEGTFDLSEWHLAYFAYVDESVARPAFTQSDPGFGSDPIFDQGGNPWISTAILSRWTGAVNESDRHYNGELPSEADPVAKHLEQVHFLSMSGAFSGADRVKTSLMEQGAVHIRIVWPFDETDVYNPTTHAFHNAAATGGGHVVAIVGWDDAYPAANFVVRPGSDGAWLVKNSWGTGWGDEGYFWLSYADPTISQSVVFTGADASNYSRIYQYDPLGWVSAYGFGSDTAWFSNVFKAGEAFSATEAEGIKAVSFYASQSGSSYRIDIYRGVTAGNPVHGTLVSSSEGNLTTAGYHTVALPDVALVPGELFSVVVRLTTPGYTFPIPVEYPEEGYSDKASANADESFVSSDGTTWTDMTSEMAGANVCLKVFTSPTAEKPDPTSGGGGGCSLGLQGFSALLLALPALLLKRR